MAAFFLGLPDECLLLAWPDDPEEFVMKQFNERFEMMDPLMVPILQRKTPDERLAIALGMWRLAKQLFEAGIQRTHPELSEEQREQQIARRMSNGAV